MDGADDNDGGGTRDTDDGADDYDCVRQKHPDNIV